MRFYWMIAVGFFLLGCKTLDKSEDVASQSFDLRAVIQEEDPQIVFLYFEIENREHNDLEIRWTQTQISEGRMKENTIMQAPKMDGNLIFHLLDENNQVQVEQIIENPLSKTIEQYSEDGKITLNQLNLEKTQFFIRFNNKNAIKTLRIYSIQAGSLVKVFDKPIQL